MSKLEQLILDREKVKILSEYPTLESLEQYFAEYSFFPMTVIELFRLGEVTYSDIKIWLYGKKEVKNYEKGND